MFVAAAFVYTKYLLTIGILLRIYDIALLKISVVTSIIPNDA